MSIEGIKTKTKDHTARISPEDYEKLPKDKKAGIHKLIVNEPQLRAQIKELTAKYDQSEAKYAQLESQISNSKLGVQPKPEDLTFDYNIVQEFCRFPVLNPLLKAPLTYMCSNKNPSLSLFSGRILTTAFCKKCNATREALLDVASDDSIYERAVKKEGRKNIPLIVTLHGQLQTITRERDDYREFKESYKERTAEAFAIADRDMRLLRDKMDEQGKIHRTQIAELTAQCKTLKSEKGNLENQIKMMESRLSEMNNHVAEFETLRIENAKFKEIVGTTEELNHVETRLKETEEQRTQAQSRLSEITDFETKMQAIQKYPDWLTRFQTIGEIDELRGKLETAENTVASLKIQQKSNNQAINTLEARNEELSTVEKTLEYDLTHLKNSTSIATNIIIDVNKYFTNKQTWESRKHGSLPENYDERPEAITLKTELPKRIRSFLQQNKESEAQR